MSGHIYIAIRHEERDLVSFHGDAYRRYRGQVPIVVPVPGRRYRQPGFLIFVLVPVTQGLAEILLVRSLRLAAFIPMPVIARNLCVPCFSKAPQSDIYHWQAHGRGQLCGEGLVVGPITLVGQLELQNMTGRCFALRQGTGDGEAAAGDPLGIVAKPNGAGRIARQS